MGESAFTLYEDEFDRQTEFSDPVSNYGSTGIMEMEQYGPHATPGAAYIGPIGWPRRKLSTLFGSDNYEDIDAFADGVQDSEFSEATVTVDLKAEAPYESADRPMVWWVTGVQAGTPGRKHIHLETDGPYVIDAEQSALPETAALISEEETVNGQPARQRAHDWLDTLDEYDIEY